MEGGVVQELLEEGCDLGNYPGGTPEDHIKIPIHQHLIEIMHEGAKGDIPTLCSRDINLVIKHVNELNKMAKCIPVKNLSDLKACVCFLFSILSVYQIIFHQMIVLQKL